MNGYEAAASIRNSNKEDAQSIPILSMTADAFGEDAIKAKNAGMNGHIAKPIVAKKMMETVSKVMEQAYQDK